VRLLSLLLVLCFATSACSRKGGAASALPPEWPVKQLTLLAGAQVFEGHVDTQHGGTAVTVFYTDASGWAAQVGHVESKLAALHYRVMPEAAETPDAEAAAAPLNHKAWCSPKGDRVVLLSEDKAPEGKVNAPGTYFTLLAKKLDQPIAVDPQWPEISK
jgi:hypothetical protein